MLLARSINKCFKRNKLSCPMFHILLVRSHLEESVGHLPMEWLLEAVHQAHSVDPGFLMEDPGMDHLPGTALPHPNWPQGLHVTTVTVSIK